MCFIRYGSNATSTCMTIVWRSKQLDATNEHLERYRLFFLSLCLNVGCIYVIAKERMQDVIAVRVCISSWVLMEHIKELFSKSSGRVQL